MHKIKLSNCVSHISYPRISTNELNSKTYITTDNMLPNKAGIVESKNMPRNISVIKFIKDDVLLSNIRPYFKKIWLAEFEGGCSTDVLIFRVNKNYNPKYIKYCLSQDSFFRYDMLGAKGSKMPRGDKNHILNFEILDIDLKSQNSIAKTLSLLDDKIKLNNKTNCELEKMAKEIYDYWFVQFEFPDKNNGPYKTNKGKMIYSPILKKEIPIDWKVDKLKKICDIKSGYPFSSDNYIAKGIYGIITIKNVQNGYIDIYTDNYINSIPNDLPQYCILKKGDILLSLTGNVGRTGLIYSDNLLLNQRVAKIILKQESFYSYIYFLISNNYFRNILEQKSTGTSQKNLSPIETENINIIIPDKNTINIFNNIAQSIIEKMVKNWIENKSLIELRDFLLPMLMNGQISIKD